MRNSPASRFFFGLLGIVFIGVLGFLFWMNSQTEYAYVYSKNVTPYTFLDNEEEYLVRITVPQNREFPVVSNPREIIGMYVGSSPVFAGDLVSANDLIVELPNGQRRFKQGLLPIGTSAYLIEVNAEENALREVLKATDFVDLLAIVDTNVELPSPEDQAVVVLQKVRALEISDTGLWVALNVDQIAAYEGWERHPDVVAFVPVISQEANGDLPPLYTSQIYPDYGDPVVRELFAAPTPTPMPELPEEPAVVDDEGETPVEGSAPAGDEG